jgi:aminopeptidase N
MRGSKIRLAFIGIWLCHSGLGWSQLEKQGFSHADTLRGSLNADRIWWDVLRYDIDVTPEFNDKSISGTARIQFKALKAGDRMQIDLQQPMVIDSIPGARFERIDNIALVSLDQPVLQGTISQIQVYYHGKPMEAVNPPWGGGWIWNTDEKGRPWMTVACQGQGASLWFPCKDHQSDEPDHGATLTIRVPDSLVAVGNGRLKSQTRENGRSVYTWEVLSPINNYCIIPYVGKYVNFTDTLMGEKGKLDLSYWVEDYDLEKARKQFEGVKLMFRALEYWFGPYPFYSDSYKLVESPHLGMEHQSAIAYGNHFKNGFNGLDLSQTGLGLSWDYIIVHESAHEWFGNSITTQDIADSWVHEGFANYAEVLYVEFYQGKQAANEYCAGLRKNIKNEKPVIGPYGVNEDGSGDMYPKGANLLHTLRHAIHQDEKFRQILRGLNAEFYHQTVTTKQVEDYISRKSGFDFSRVFDQYLRQTGIPTLEYFLDSLTLRVSYRWTDCIDGFNLPLVLAHSSLYPDTQWKTTAISKEGLEDWRPPSILENYYIKMRRLKSRP